MENTFSRTVPTLVAIVVVLTTILALPCLAGASTVEEPSVALLVVNAGSLDADEQCAFDFATSRGFTIVPVDPSRLESHELNLSDYSVYWAASSAEPANWNNASILCSLESEIAGGKYLLVMAGGTFVAQYLGHGYVGTGGWWPSVQDTHYLVDYDEQGHPAMENLSRWTGDLSADREAQVLWKVREPGSSIFTYGITFSNQVSIPSVVLLTTYGWAGQGNDPGLDAAYNFTSTPDRALHEWPLFTETRVGDGAISNLPSLWSHGFVYGPMGQELLAGFLGSVPPRVMKALPGAPDVPTDTNVDGLYDDVNGNGRRDFADVVLYFNQMSWITAHEPLEAFDYNGNGRIDFADVVWLFSHL